jgi:hypothetical protein
VQPLVFGQQGRIALPKEPQEVLASAGLKIEDTGAQETGPMLGSRMHQPFQAPALIGEPRQHRRD